MYLEGRFSGDMGDEKVHGYVLTVHEGVHHVSYLLRLPVGVEVGVVLQRERKSGREGGREGGRERDGWREEGRGHPLILKSTQFS